MIPLRPLAWRPGLVVLLGLASGLAVGAAWGWPVAGAALALACEGWRARGLGLAAVLLGVLLRPGLPPVAPELRSGTLAARVATIPRATAGGSSFLADVSTKEGGAGRLAAFAPARGLSLGDELRVEGRIVPLQRGSDDYLVSRRVSGHLRVRSLARVRSGSRAARGLTELSDGISGRLEARLGPERGRLVGAVCFNLDGLLDDRETEVLRRSGAYHLVSASGLHAATIAGTVALLGLVVPVPRAAWLVFGALVLVGYTALTGWHAATLRSAALWAVASLAYTLRRGGDGLSVLGWFGAFWLAASPGDLYDVGFALTMLVTGAILAVPRAISSAEARTKFGLRVGLVAWIASEPILALTLGRWQPLALPANVALALASEATLLTGLAAGLLPGLPGDLAAIPCRWSADLLDATAKGFGTPAWSQLPLSGVGPPLVLAVYAALAAAWLLAERRRCPLPPP